MDYSKVTAMEYEIPVEFISDDTEKVIKKLETLKEKLTITTLVQLRNEKLGMVFLNNYSSDNKSIFASDYGCITYLHSYNDDLTINSGDKSHDIIRIKFPSAEENYKLTKNFFNENINPEEIDWDWERKI